MFDRRCFKDPESTYPAFIRYCRGGKADDGYWNGGVHVYGHSPMTLIERLLLHRLVQYELDHFTTGTEQYPQGRLHTREGRPRAGLLNLTDFRQL